MQQEKQELHKDKNENKTANDAAEASTNMIEDSCFSNNEEAIRDGAIPRLKSSKPVKNMFPKDKFDTDIEVCIKGYELSENTFHNAYNIWIPERMKIMSELRELADNVHHDQFLFNNTNLVCKEGNAACRRLSSTDESNLALSFGSLVMDTVCGLASFDQACKIDNYTKQFSTIMDNDAEFTKPLYDARSNCFSKYKAVEEVVRCYYLETFESTQNKISRNLRMEDMWRVIKSATNGDSRDSTQISETIDSFFMQIPQVFDAIYQPLENYVDNNPAALDTCVSAGKVLFDIYDIWGRDSSGTNHSLVSKSISRNVNQAIIRRDEAEISRLRRIVNDENQSQAKLESIIRDTLKALELETEEMEKHYKASSH